MFYNVIKTKTEGDTIDVLANAQTQDRELAFRTAGNWHEREETFGFSNRPPRKVTNLNPQEQIEIYETETGHYLDDGTLLATYKYYETTV